MTEFGRTRETADLALGDQSVPRIVLRDLNDPFYGSFEGKLLAEYRKWAGSHGPLDVPPGEGEAQGGDRRALRARLHAARPRGGDDPGRLSLAPDRRCTGGCVTGGALGEDAADHAG